MATTTTNFGWDIPQSTDLVKDGATAIAALGQDIDTALVDLKGGTTGQVLAKASGTDLDYSWVAIDPLVILDAKGDLITATAADTPARLAVGTNGHVLTADSTTATGIKWAAVAAGGKVLQVVTATTTTATTISTTTYADSGLSASITPSSASSKILVLITQPTLMQRSTSQANAGIKLLRGATTIADFAPSGYESFGVTAGGTSIVAVRGMVTVSWLDSPSTTSATTYKTQGRTESNSNSPLLQFQEGGAPGSIILMEIGA